MLATNPGSGLFSAIARIRWAVAGAMLATIALTALYVWQDWHETVARVEERVMSFTTVTEAYVRRRLRETESGMKVMADLHRGGLASASAIRDIGSLHRRNFPFIEAIAVLDGERTDMVSGEFRIATPLLDWARQQIAGEGRLLVGRPLLFGDGHNPVIPLLIRFRGEAGRPDTRVAAAIRSDVLGLMHAALRLDEHKVSLVHNDEGIILSRQPYDASAIGFNLTGYYPSGKLPDGQLPTVARFTSPIDGRTFIRGTIHLKDYPLAVRGGEVWSQAIAPWRDRTIRSILIAAVLIAAIAILGKLAMQQARREQQAQIAQQRSSQVYRDTLSTLTEGVVTHGPDGAVLTFNDAALRILGLTADQLAGRTSLDPRWRSKREDGSEFPGNEHPAVQALATGQPQRDVLMEIESGDGGRRWIEINAVPTRAGDVITGAVVSFSDVTARRATLAQLAALNHTLETRVAERTEQLRQLSGELAAAEDRERRQLSRDLHDDIAQTLAAARIHLSGLTVESVGHAGDVAKAVGALIKQADDSVRALAAQLAPPALVEIGLVAGLHWLADEMGGKFGLEVQVIDDGEPKPLTQGARTIVYRAVRELLINASKHAGVRQAAVDCRCEGNDLVIEVEDAGKGFLPDSASAGERAGLGLQGVGERIGYIGGSLHWATPYGGGTRAILVIPLTQDASQKAELPA